MQLYDAVNSMFLDYFNIEIPVTWLTENLDSEAELIKEMSEFGVTDTDVRGQLINLVCRKIGIVISKPNLFGESGSHSWPCYGDSKEYSAEFHQQLKEKLVVIGGQIN